MMLTGNNITVHTRSLRPEFFDENEQQFATKVEDNYCIDAPLFIDAGSCKTLWTFKCNGITRACWTPTFISREK